MIRFISLLLLMLAGPAIFADGRLFTLDVQPAPDERYQSVEFFCWVPDTEKPINAVIIHQHGCTNASPEKHPPVTFDSHWQALARKHNCALLSPQYFVSGSCAEWNDPDSGSERALFTALKDFARRSDHAEIIDAPWVLWGHSGGSSWSSQMIVRHPDRVLAAAYRGGSHKQFGDPEFRARFIPVALDIPLLFVWGKRETVSTSRHFVSWGPMNTAFRELRSRGGKAARMVDPDSEHGCDNSRLVTIPFLDSVLTAKLADNPLPGVYLNIETLEAQDDNDASGNDPATAWLPNPEVAGLWQEFSRTGHLPPHDPPQSAPVLKAKPEADGMLRLSWEVSPDLIGGLRAYHLYRDNKRWKQLGLEPRAAIATSRDSTPESLRQTSITVDAAESDHTFSLTFIDAAGQESPRSEPVESK